MKTFIIFAFTTLFVTLHTQANTCSFFSITKDSTGEVLLKKGALLSIQLIEAVNSEEAIEGSIVQFVVYKAKQVSGDVIFSERCYGEGRITSVVHKRSFGRGGSITIVPFNVETTDGERILVNSQPITIKGNDKKAFAWVLSSALPLFGVASLSPGGLMLLPFGLVGFLVRGDAAELNNKTILSVQVAEDTYLQTKGKTIKINN